MVVRLLRKYCRAFSPSEFAQWGTADAEVKVHSVENPELANVLPLKPGAGQNIATHASSTVRNFFLVLIRTFSVHSP